MPQKRVGRTLSAAVIVSGLGLMTVSLTGLVIGDRELGTSGYLAAVAGIAGVAGRPQRAAIWGAGAGLALAAALALAARAVAPTCGEIMAFDEFAAPDGCAHTGAPLVAASLFVAGGCLVVAMLGRAASGPLPRGAASVCGLLALTPVVAQGAHLAWDGGSLAALTAALSAAWLVGVLLHLRRHRSPQRRTPRAAGAAATPPPVRPGVSPPRRPPA